LKQNVIKHDERHFISIKGKIYQKKISILNIYAPNVKAPKSIKETLLKLNKKQTNKQTNKQKQKQTKKTHIDTHTIIVGDINTPHSPLDRSSKPKINKDLVKLREDMQQMELTYIYRTFHCKRKEYTFFSAPHATFSKINHTICQKTILNRYKKIELIPCILSDHHDQRLAFNNSKTYRKSTYPWKVNNSLLSDTLITKEIKKVKTS
jgi:exonuclease III